MRANAGLTRHPLRVGTLGAKAGLLPQPATVPVTHDVCLNRDAKQLASSN